MASNIVEARNFEWKIHNFSEDVIKNMTTKMELSTDTFEILLGENVTKW